MVEIAQQSVSVVRAQTDSDYEKSAVLLSVNEPWVTLGRSYEYSLKKVRTPEDELFVAKVDGQVAGCVLIQMHGQLKGFIRSICVDGDYRGCGVGSILLKAAEERIYKETPNVFLFVSSFNSRAKALYERSGYHIIGTFTDYVIRGCDEILLRKTIGPSNGFPA